MTKDEATSAALAALDRGEKSEDAFASMTSTELLELLQELHVPGRSKAASKTARARLLANFLLESVGKEDGGGSVATSEGDSRGKSRESRKALRRSAAKKRKAQKLKEIRARQEAAERENLRKREEARLAELKEAVRKEHAALLLKNRAEKAAYINRLENGSTALHLLRFGLEKLTEAMVECMGGCYHNAPPVQQLDHTQLLELLKSPAGAAAARRTVLTCAETSERAERLRGTPAQNLAHTISNLCERTKGACVAMLKASTANTLESLRKIFDELHTCKIMSTQVRLKVERVIEDGVLSEELGLVVAGAYDKTAFHPC